MKRFIAGLVLLIGWSAIAGAQSTTTEAETLKRLQDKFQTTFSNMPVVSFDKGPIDGLYELNINGQVMYYNPDHELIFIGEIFSKDGHSLTAEKKALLSQEKIRNLPLDKALVIGPADGIPVIEFTDPDCPYCRAYNQYVLTNHAKVKRYIFFFTRIHPDSPKKSLHILCAKDREKAFQDVFAGKDLPWQSCPEGQALLAAHDKASRDVGITGTPSFALDGTLVTGFKQSAIEDYIKLKSQAIKR